MKRIQFGLLVAGMLSVLSTSAQDTRDVATHQHTWFMAFGNHRLSDTWGVHTEYQFRRTGVNELEADEVKELAARLLEESNDLGWSEAEFYEKEPWAKGL